jgi:hypothetical protein
MEDIQTIVEKVKMDLQAGKSDQEIFQTALYFFGRDPEIDRHVIESLAAIPQVKIANILRLMLRVSKEKKVQKIIKRSLYRLKSRGINAEEVLPEKKSSVLRPFQMESPKGFGGGFDFLGQRFLLLVIPHRGRGWIVARGVVSDTQGLIDFLGEEMARKGFKGFFEEVQEKNPFPLVEMEASYVGLLFFQAYHLTLEKKRALIYSILQADEIAGDDRILRRGGELLKADVISSWRIEEDQIRPFADEVWEAEESKIVLSQPQKETRFQGIYQKALSELFNSEERFLYQRRLEEMAYIFFKLGREEEAKISLAVAIDLEKPASPLQPNPFLFQLVIKSIFTLLKEAYEKKVKEPSLIVKP